MRCDVCRGYARLYLAEIRDTDSRTKTFSCCRSGSDGALAITEPHGNRHDGLSARPGSGAAASPCRCRSAQRHAKACLSSVSEALRGEGAYALISQVFCGPFALDA